MNFFSDIKYQICFFSWFESVECFLFDEWRSDCFHVSLIFSKSLVLPFLSIQNKHALKSRQQYPENVKESFWFLLLVLSEAVNPSQFSTLEYVQLFKDSCLEISINILYWKTSILDSFRKLKETLRTEIQICFVQSFFFLFGCFFGWNRFWCSSENLTT